MHEYADVQQLWFNVYFFYDRFLIYILNFLFRFRHFFIISEVFFLVEMERMVETFDENYESGSG